MLTRIALTTALAIFGSTAALCLGRFVDLSCVTLGPVAVSALIASLIVALTRAAPARA
jgi:hypothetical protein